MANITYAIAFGTADNWEHAYRTLDLAMMALALPDNQDGFIVILNEDDEVIAEVTLPGTPVVEINEQGFIVGLVK